MTKRRCDVVTYQRVVAQIVYRVTVAAINPRLNFAARRNAKMCLVDTAKPKIQPRF
jgi:hypothetical protein